MPSKATDRFLERAAVLGLELTPRRFPDGTRTAPEAARAVGCDVAQIVKSLVFVLDGRAVLVLTSGANRVDEAKLAAVSGASSVRKATAAEVRAATGYAIGGTPPFGHDTELEVLCDRHLLDHEVVWAAAGTPMDVVPLTPEQLLAASRATPVEIHA
ncbi:MAG: YbaK/EbsC family protein [Nitriliruptoraceae bacterium]